MRLKCEELLHLNLYSRVQTAKTNKMMKSMTTSALYPLTPPRELRLLMMRSLKKVSLNKCPSENQLNSRQGRGRTASTSSLHSRAGSVSWCLLCPAPAPDMRQPLPQHPRDEAVLDQGHVLRRVPVQRQPHLSSTTSTEYSTVQHSTVLHSTAQYSIIRFRMVKK